ncbi:hypothetical protein Emed_000146 [Eimeria media]
MQQQGAPLLLKERGTWEKPRSEQRRQHNIEGGPPLSAKERDLHTVRQQQQQQQQQQQPAAEAPLLAFSPADAAASRQPFELSFNSSSSNNSSSSSSSNNSSSSSSSRRETSGHPVALLERRHLRPTGGAAAKAVKMPVYTEGFLHQQGCPLDSGEKPRGRQGLGDDPNYEDLLETASSSSSGTEAELQHHKEALKAHEDEVEKLCADKRCCTWFDLANWFGFLPLQLPVADFEACFTDVAHGGTGLYEKLVVLGGKTLDIMAEIHFYEMFESSKEVKLPLDLRADKEAMRLLWARKRVERVTSMNSLFLFGRSYLATAQSLPTRQAVAKFVKASIGYCCQTADSENMYTWMPALIEHIFWTQRLTTERLAQDNAILQDLQEFLGYKYDHLIPRIRECLEGSPVPQRSDAPTGRELLRLYATDYFTKMSEETGVEPSRRALWVDEEVEHFLAGSAIPAFASLYMSLAPFVLDLEQGGPLRAEAFSSMFESLIAACWIISTEEKVKVWMPSLIQRLRQVGLIEYWSVGSPPPPQGLELSCMPCAAVSVSPAHSPPLNEHACTLGLLLHAQTQLTLHMAQLGDKYFSANAKLRKPAKQPVEARRFASANNGMVDSFALWNVDPMRRPLPEGPLEGAPASRSLPEPLYHLPMRGPQLTESPCCFLPCVASRVVPPPQPPPNPPGTKRLTLFDGERNRYEFFPVGVKGLPPAHRRRPKQSVSPPGLCGVRGVNASIQTSSPAGDPQQQQQQQQQQLQSRFVSTPGLSAWPAAAPAPAGAWAPQQSMMVPAPAPGDAAAAGAAAAGGEPRVKIRYLTDDGSNGGVPKSDVEVFIDDVPVHTQSLPPFSGPGGGGPDFRAVLSTPNSRPVVLNFARRGEDGKPTVYVTEGRQQETGTPWLLQPVAPGPPAAAPPPQAPAACCGCSEPSACCCAPRQTSDEASNYAHAPPSRAPQAVDILVSPAAPYPAGSSPAAAVRAYGEPSTPPVSCVLGGLLPSCMPSRPQPAGVSSVSLEMVQ